MGTLFIVATPIGNLQDITLRAVEILKNADYIACEDTRKTGILLKSLGIPKKAMLISYFEHTEDIRIPNILNLLQNDQNVVLVSDSGTPTISDPGFRLVRACFEKGIKVLSIPGPSAVISSLASSGLPTDKFIFLGFLPRKEGNRKKMLQNLKEIEEKVEATAVIYEAPHRLAKTLLSIKECYGDKEIVIARELTKMYEETIHQKVSYFIDLYSKKEPKGEFVILISFKQP